LANAAGEAGRTDTVTSAPAGKGGSRGAEI
jgi:hypothetical protein